MCLLLHKPAGVTFTDDWLTDFTKSNADGYGFLYVEDGRLHVHKSLGNTERFIEAFRARERHECLIHLRMRTHGDIDLENCHPYEVLTREEGGATGAIWMMHNGILTHGNAPDKAKSDTWHYINSWLKPILRKCPELILDTAFQGLVENDIGSSNKFAFMTSTGAVVVLNRDSGIEWQGAWMSNTYAWSAPGASKSYGLGSHNDYSYEYENYKPHMADALPAHRAGYWDIDTNAWITSTSTQWRPMEERGNWRMAGEDCAVVRCADEGVERMERMGDLSVQDTREATRAFFKLLDSNGFEKAHNTLTFLEVESAFEYDWEETSEIYDAIDRFDVMAPADEDYVLDWVRASLCKVTKSKWVAA